MSASSATFSYPVRVYYEDTDAGGVVYHARYLHFFERARTEWLRTFHFSQQDLLNQTGGGFVVKRMEIDYYHAAVLDDLLNVETSVTEIKGATIMFEQFLKCGEVILSKAIVKIAYVDLTRMKPTAIPAEIKAAITN